MPDRIHTRQFLTAFLAIYAAIAVAIGLNLVVLWRGGELQTLDAILNQQGRDGAIYNALSISFADYKYAAYRKTAPEIVVIGTSRAMQIRQHMFSRPFYNLGGLVQGPFQANSIAERLLLRDSRPKVVLFALDYWTFCRQPSERIGGLAPAEVAHDGMNQPDRNFLIYRLLLEKRFSATDFARLMISPETTIEHERIGLGARLGGAGFARDGSLYSAAPKGEPLEDRWTGTTALIQSGTAQMIKDCAVSDLALDAVERFIRKMEAAKIQVVLMLAPLPGATLERMTADGRYGYLPELQSALAKRFSGYFYDFLDMRNQAPDSEFLDGIHGGEVAYMRIIAAIADRSPSALRNFVNVQDLHEKIRTWAGCTYVPIDPIFGKFYSRDSESSKPTAEECSPSLAHQ